MYLGWGLGDVVREHNLNMVIKTKQSWTPPVSAFDSYMKTLTERYKAREQHEKEEKQRKWDEEMENFTPLIANTQHYSDIT